MSDYPARSMATARRAGPRDRSRIFVASFATAFAAFLLLGGGGAPAPAIHSLHQVLALVTLCFFLWWHLFIAPLRQPRGWAAVFILVLLLIPALQLVPLPWSLWSSLPGRELPARVLEVAGLAPHWRPLSLDPEATRFAGATLLVPVAAFIGASALDRDRRILLVKLLLIVALISAGVAALQAALPGTSSLYLYPRAIFTQASGLFANRNFQSDLLLIAILFAAFLSRVQPGRLTVPGTDRRYGLSAVLIPFFALLVIATQSKTGALLLLPVLLLALLTLFGTGRGGRVPLYAGAAAAAVAALALSATRIGTALAERFESFDPSEEIRSAALPDIWHAVELHYPFGSGLGTFDLVYRSVERLQNVQEKYLNHAHNDYLEVLLEAGPAGILLTALFIIALVVRGWQVWRRRGQSRHSLLERVSLAGLAILVLHSMGDYPLRTVTLLAVFGMLCAFLFTDPADASVGEGRNARKAPPLAGKKRLALGAGAALVVIGAVASWTTLTIGAARQLAQAGVGSTAFDLRPSNSRAAAVAAGVKLAQGDAVAAQRIALQGVAASPMDAAALRTLGEARNRLKRGSGDEEMVMAARLTWRDGPTQVWVIERAILTGQLLIAGERVEAMARRNEARELVYAMTRLLALDPQMRERIIGNLAEKPVWRQGFLTDGAPKTRQQLEALALILEGLAVSRAPANIAEARMTIDELLLAGEGVQAWQLRNKLFGQQSSRDSLLSDSGFQRSDTSYQPADNNTLFDWRVYASGGSEAGVEDDPDRKGNRVVYAAWRSGPPAELMTRITALPPGAYRFRYRVRAVPQGPEALRWDLRCGTGGGPPFAGGVLAPVGGSAWESREFAFAIPPACPVQRISLSTVGLASGGEANIDDVVILRPEGLAGASAASDN